MNQASFRGTIAGLVGLPLIISAAIAFAPHRKQVPETKYPVYHTQVEWDRKIGGLTYAQDLIRSSSLPANEAFVADSILQSQINDIRAQVIYAMQKDTTNKK